MTYTLHDPRNSSAVIDMKMGNKNEVDFREIVYVIGISRGARTIS